MDPALFMKYFSQEELIGVIVSHVDDFMHGGTPEFKTNKLAEIFQIGKTEATKFKYVGYQIEQSGRGIKVDQTSLPQRFQSWM